MKIICVAKNFAAHACEMGSKNPEQPLFFLKPDSSLLLKNQAFFYPDFSNTIHYELELVVRINRLGKNIQERFAHKYYEEVALGVDFTARDLQEEAKRNGHPWTLSKGFDNSALLGTFIPLNKLDKPIEDLNYRLLKNGIEVQSANSGDMLFSVNVLISYLSRFMTLKIGDLLYTGTPSGVGPVQIGDQLEGFLEDCANFSCLIK